MITFADIKGNPSAVASLRAMADSRRVPHALMLYENPRGGGMALAVAFLSYLYCEYPVDGHSCGQCPSCLQMAKLVHPDVHFVFPVNKGDVIKSDKPLSNMAVKEFRELFLRDPFFSEQQLYDALGIDSKVGVISVLEAKEIIGELSLSSVAGGYKSVVMFLPERMNAQAANKLLKILEEPPEDTVFMLVTQNPDEVMGTIFSRCQAIRVLPSGRESFVVATDYPEIEAIWQQLLECLLAKDLLGSLECADKVEALKSREKQKAFCNFASQQLRAIFMYSRSLGDIAYAEKTPLSDSAAACFKSGFYPRAASALDRASMLIGGNVSAKMVFTDLVNRLFVNL